VPPFAFPGVYSGTVGENLLYAETTAEAEADDDDIELPAVLQLEFESELAAGAEEAVQAAVNAHLDLCLQDHALSPSTLNPGGEPTTCPFGLTGEEQLTVNWSIGRYPDITLTPWGTEREVVIISSAADGLVRYDLPAGWVDDEFEFSFDGRAAVVDGIIQVSTQYQ
jgi:hypothetical protein